MRQKLKREGGADRRQELQKGDRRCRKWIQRVQRELPGNAEKGDRR